MWIALKDKKPDEGQSVLCCTAGLKESHLVTEYRDGEFWIFGWNATTVTHWVPLPDVPPDNRPKVY